MVSRGTWGVAEAPGGDGLVFSAALWPKPHIFVCWPVTIGDGSRPSTRPHPKIMVFVFEYRVSGNLRDTGYRFISSRHLVPSKPGQKSLKSSSRSTITSQTVVTTSKYCYSYQSSFATPCPLLEICRCLAIQNVWRKTPYNLYGRDRKPPNKAVPPIQN